MGPLRLLVIAYEPSQLELVLAGAFVLYLLIKAAGRWRRRPPAGRTRDLRTLGPPPPPGPMSWIPYEVTCPTCKGSELGKWHELCETCGGAGVVLAYRADPG